MLYSDLGIIFKSIEEQYRERMNKMKTEIKCKTPYTEKTNSHAVWMVYHTAPLLTEMFLIH